MKQLMSRKQEALYLVDKENYAGEYLKVGHSLLFDMEPEASIEKKMLCTRDALAIFDEAVNVNPRRISNLAALSYFAQGSAFEALAAFDSSAKETEAAEAKEAKEEDTPEDLNVMIKFSYEKCTEIMPQFAPAWLCLVKFLNRMATRSRWLSVATSFSSSALGWAAMDLIVKKKTTKMMFARTKGAG
jgi:hypothetical protein